MKLRTVLFSSLLASATFSANAVDIGAFFSKLFGGEEKAATEQVETAAKEKVAEQQSTLVDYAAEQLGLSKEVTSGALGAVFKVAKDNLSNDNFASISQAIPNLDSYLNSAPNVSKSSLSGLASTLGQNNDAAKAAASLGYLDSAFKKLGVPKESVLPLVNVVTNYLEQNNYGTAATMLKQGINFL